MCNKACSADIYSIYMQEQEKPEQTQFARLNFSTVSGCHKESPAWHSGKELINCD